MRITLQFSTTGGPIAYIVRKSTRSQFSHVDIVLPDGQLLGSQMRTHFGSGVQLRPADYEKFTRIARYHVDVPDGVSDKIIFWARTQIGKPYDLPGVLGIFFGKRDWHEDDSWFCSEYVAEAFNYAGFPLITEQVNRVTPEMLRSCDKLVLESLHNV
jgi:uncharacterized protein YycO